MNDHQKMDASIDPKSFIRVHAGNELRFIEIISRWDPFLLPDVDWTARAAFSVTVGKMIAKRGDGR